MTQRLKTDVSVTSYEGGNRIRTKLEAEMSLATVAEELGCDEDEVGEYIGDHAWYEEDDEPTRRQAKAAAEDFEDFGDGLDKMTIPDLRDHASRMDPPVDLEGLTKKKDIIQAIRASDGAE